MNVGAKARFAVGGEADAELRVGDLVVSSGHTLEVGMDTNGRLLLIDGIGCGVDRFEDGRVTVRIDNTAADAGAPVLVVEPQGMAATVLLPGEHVEADTEWLPALPDFRVRAAMRVRGPAGRF